MSCNYNCTDRDTVSAFPAEQGRAPPPLDPRTPMMALSGQRGWNPGAPLPPCYGGQPRGNQGVQQGWTTSKPVQNVGQQNQSSGYARGNSPAAVRPYEESLDSGYPSASYSPSRGASRCPGASTSSPSSAATCVAAYGTPSFPPQTPHSARTPAYPSPPPSYPSPPPSYRSPPPSYPSPASAYPSPAPSYPSPAPAYPSAPSPYTSPVRRASPSSPGYAACQRSARAAAQGNRAAAGARMPVNAWGSPGGMYSAGRPMQGMPSAQRSPAPALRSLYPAQQHSTPHRAENVTFAEYPEQPYPPSSPQRGQAAARPQLRITPSHRVVHLPEGPKGAINLEVTLPSHESLVTDAFTADSYPDSFTPDPYPDSFPPESVASDSFLDPLCPHAICTVSLTPEQVAQESFVPGAPSSGAKEDEAKFLVSLNQRAAKDAPPATTTPPCSPTNMAVCPGECFADPAPGLCPVGKASGSARAEEVPLEVRALFSGLADVLAQPAAGAAYRQPVRLRGVVTPSQPPRTCKKSTAQMPDAGNSPPEGGDSEIDPEQDVAKKSRTSSPVSSSSPGACGKIKCSCCPDKKPPEAPPPARPAGASAASQGRGGRLTSIRRLETPAGPVWSAMVSADGAAYDVMATLAADQPAGAA